MTASPLTDISGAISAFIAGAEVPATAIAKLTPEQLRARPIPGTWSIQEIVVHLWDSDLVGCDRMRRLAAMDNPLIMAYDESEFNRALSPDRLDAHGAAEIFRLNRLLFGEILKSLPAEAFARSGVHNERGRITLGGTLSGYVEHLDGHMQHLLKKRAMVAGHSVAPGSVGGR